MTTDKNIKKLLHKFDKHQKNAERKEKSIVNKQTKESDKFSFLKLFDFTPPRPPKAMGFVEKMGIIGIFFNSRFIEVDPIIGTFKRYKTSKDYPSNPM